LVSASPALTPQQNGNLHVFSNGCEEIGQMLLFRDWLRQSSDDKRLYEERQRRLAAQTWKYTQNYADSKAEVVHAILARARLNQILSKAIKASAS